MNKKVNYILFILIVSTVFASFINLSLDDIVKKSDLIIIGQIDSIKFAEPAEDKYKRQSDIGYITIQEILYNGIFHIDSTTKEIPL